MSLTPSGHRLTARYRVIAESHKEALKRAEAIAVEQTIEFPPELVQDPQILEEIVARIESVEALDNGAYEVLASFALETAGAQLSQLQNLLYGNTSLQPGVRLTGFSLPPQYVAGFSGPRFGVDGLYRLFAADKRALLCTALKPMGLSAQALAKLAATFAAGGIDVIKDDHGLVDQPFCPFDERVARCAEAVNETNQREGTRAVYAANITADGERLFERAERAVAAGAGAVMVAPGLVGFDRLSSLCHPKSGIGVPILAHPAWQPALANPEHGISPAALLGTLTRLAGADISIFPSYGGRFSFTELDCAALRDAARESAMALCPMILAPAGGLTVSRVPELLDFYGSNVMLLIGGDLHRVAASRSALSRLDALKADCEQFRRSAEQPERVPSAPSLH
jgi:ribulose-bisphosphate carboxylase large chain